MKKLISCILLLLLLAGCGGSPAPSTEAPDFEPEPEVNALSLTGQWKEASPESEKAGTEPTASSEAQKTKPRAEDTMTSVQNASPLDKYLGQYIRIKNSAGYPDLGEHTVFCTKNAKGQTVLKFGAEMTDEAGKKLAEKLNASGLGPLAFQPVYVSAASQEEINAWKGSETPSVEPSGTVKADTSVSPVEFYAYYGESNGNVSVKAPVLTEEQVKAAIAAAENTTIDKVTVDLKNNVARTDRKLLTLTAAAVSGGYKNPKRLYKVTVEGMGVQYVRFPGKLTGMKDVAAVRLLQGLQDRCGYFMKTKERP